MAVTADIRERVGKLLGMIGSSSEGEKKAALAAVEGALSKAGTTWAWIGSLVAHGDLPSGDREKILSRLVADRLRDGLCQAWAMSDGEARELRDIAARCETALASVSPADLARAIAIADNARRRAGVGRQ